MFSKTKNSPAALLLSSLAASSMVASAEPTVAPRAVTTSAAELSDSSTRVTTSFYSFVTTQIPRDERSIGMGLQREGTDEYYWLYCINDPFTTKSGFAGCGTDDLYTACSSRVATGIDGGEILCDQQCVTHKIYADLDVTTFTPFIGCGKGTSTMNLVRTSTGTASPASVTAEEESTSATATASQTDSSGHRLQCGVFYLVSLAAAMHLFV
ncbi:hypothetical protein F5X68DRAFT_243075 [Plectosphaerella plurivora]|uniref:Uncharacterized protein n=1 Tax=Plectosphaerella plurivora TaxID=936078 RepID=A0A9P9A9T6_9PEZI|nr:hypothetical protein F5X68DRAFT_243075 [Plectosphaerella plurivora]